MSCDLNVLTVAELKQRLRIRELPTTGAKSELIARLYEADPTGSWVEESELDDGAGAERDEAREDIWRREVELYKREKELAERELEIARREIALLRGQGREDPVDEVAGRATFGDGETAHMRPRANLSAVADLLNDFDGVSSDFDTWEKQARFLKVAYRLDDDCARLLIGMRLKKRAFEWFHSKPEYISMSFERLLEEMRTMFRRHESKLYLRKRFESRVWKREETFQEYVHEKTIMGNRVSIEKDELLEYVVDGIPDVALRDQARIRGFSSVDDLLKAFERITLRGATGSSRHGGDKRVRGEEENEYQALFQVW